MSLASQVDLLAAAIRDKLNLMAADIASASGAGSGNIDGGDPTTVYSLTSIDGGTP